MNVRSTSPLGVLIDEGLSQLVVASELQIVQTIASISLWGRTDCCPEMTSNFHVFVSDNAFTSTDLNTTLNQAGVSNYYHSGFAGPTSSTGSTSINVNRTGRYVRVQLAGTGSLALGEVQIWSEAAKLEWLVTDQLGTPRLVVDKTGTLSGVSRHDYLPFGEELFDGTGGRTTTQRYSAADGVRQQFTSKERDSETGLDFFEARYYSNVQGRFTSVDPEQEGARNDDAQSWNGYAYARNSPLVYTDPNGRTTTICDANGKNCVDYSDKDFDKLRKGGPADGYTFSNGKFYYNGEFAGTYSNDCLYCGQLVNEMAARGPAVKKLVGHSL